MKEAFENRRLYGWVNVACKFEDGTKRMWKTEKEEVVSNIVSIVEQYRSMGYRLTLRQLHYQFVANVPGYVNHDSAYKKLGKILDDCRYSGFVDWDAIADRGRVPKNNYTVEDIPDALKDTVDTYRLNRQKDQDNHVEVWTEKDALSEIFWRSCSRYGVTLCVNKGYTSSSAIYESYTRIAEKINEGKTATILYFGDHDPSGLDMIRDVEDRLRLMLENGRQLETGSSDDLIVKPIGLTMKQIEKYRLPPNPTKMTDSRSPQYIKAFGSTCWEVDALKPEVLTQIVEENIVEQIDMRQYGEMLKQEQNDIIELKKIIKKYDRR